ncbi:hypothetical protein C464_10988 [Halorubrum coriense DSM 10284]|uniref:Uncharacterized protein n=1 Tax=Halorubrum coriense DSM 10284 TaxID=1227466 RepID=M0EEZ7_9EURY|nr:hypothetical protein [Halorubrum coriense]ELZ46335.1 hypothetical protein C464_10988 [Halorubrum coriense DSM 10284]
MADSGDSPTKAAQYRHDDGSVEIVFAVDDGRVLTVREYPDEETFETATGSAAYVGQHEGVSDLPGVEAFEEADES